MKKIIFGILVFTVVFLVYRYGYLLQSTRNLPRPDREQASRPEVLTPSSDSHEPDPELSQKISLPSGFAINYFAKNVPGARSLALGKNGVVFVGTKDLDRVYALSDQRYVIASGLDTPNGVAYVNGDLFVAENSRLLKFSGIDSTYKNNPKYEVIFDQLPKETHHGWKYLSVGPDGKLYVPIGAPCNICDRGDPYASLTRLNLDGSGWEVVARGIRNTVGFTWDESGRLWFTDNGRDWAGDNLPADELNMVTAVGNHFGYPYCHQGDWLDPQFGRGKDCSNFISPALKLGPHVAALGLKFYQGKILIAEHGSWNRSTPIGYRISQVDVSGTKASNYRVFAQGWLDKSGDAWGRPVDILVMPDDSLLVSDDLAGAVYRIFQNTELIDKHPIIER